MAAKDTDFSPQFKREFASKKKGTKLFPLHSFYILRASKANALVSQLP